MRVYEYAKKRGVPYHDVLAFLKKSGFAVQSHMSVIPQDAVPVLDKKFKSTIDVCELKSESEEIVREPAPVVQEGPAVPAGVPEGGVIDIARQSAPGVERELGIAAEPMTVGEFAMRTKKPVGDVILTLLRQGVAAARNQVISEKVVGQLALHYGIALSERVKASEEKRESVAELRGPSEGRLPVVVVMGHVDHGKTTLLDFVRKTRVADKEKGGITQHLGAYEVATSHGNLVFIDTPGHEAFIKIRERGTRVADVAVLVIAADDGVMPQTVEVIRRVQAAQVPLVVAINKIDKASPRQIEAVKRGLTQYGIVPEDWGGQVPCVPISAKFGTGVDDLLELLVLQAQLMELTAMLAVPARGYIIETKKEKGRGVVATVICKHGILHVGDYFIAGDRAAGKVTSIVNSSGKRVALIHPSQPAQVTGFDDLPQTGDFFEVVSSERVKKFRQKAPSDFSGSAQHAVAGEEGINIIIKADNDSSREALLGAIQKINETAYRRLRVVFSGVGDVSESDVQLACDTRARIYVFYAKVDPNSATLALKCGVAVHQFDIIYRLLDELQALSATGRPVKMVLKKTGEAVVLKVFDIKSLGVVAGALVRSGRISKDARVIVWRGQYKVGEGAIKSLQREKKPIKEALTGFECAFMVDGFSDWLPDDRVEAYQEVPQGTA